MTHRIIGLLVTLALTILVAPLAIAAPPSKNVPRIGVLSPFSPATGQATGDSLGQEMVDAFRQGLQALGYLEGQTVRLEYRWAEGHPERLAELAADLVRLPVDILVTVSMAGVRAAQRRLPAMYQGRAFAEAGELMSCGTDRLDQGCRAASYVDKILKGAKPTDLPIEQPTTFELVINLKTAKALGLTIPPTLLFQADKVIR